MMELALPAVHQTGGGRLRTGPDLATEGTEFTERFIPLSSTRQAGCFRWESSVLSVTSVARHSSPESVRKGQWRSKLGGGVAIGIGIEWPWEGIRT